MSDFGVFRAQLVSIMEILAKAAVEEINRSVNDSCAVFRLEISQSQKEIETLKHKLQIVERELIKTRIRKTVCSPAERVLGQVWSSRSSEEELIGVEDVESPSQPSVTRNQSRPEPFPIKRERVEEDLSCHGPQSSSTGEEQETQVIPFGHPEELREQRRCGRGDEELSGLECLVKAEQEEEHVAQRLNQTECELSAGRFNNLGSECVMYEGDNQMWTSFTQGNIDIESDDPVCSNATERCSQHQSIHSQIQLTPASMEVSGNMLSFVGASYAEEFDKMVEKQSVCSEELRSEAIHTQQGQYRDRLNHTVERENQTTLPQQQQQGPSVKHRKGNERPAQPHSGCTYWTSSTLNTGSFVAGNHRKTRRRPGFRERLFSCTQCEKRFEQNSQLVIHQRSHTGEKPYSCADCGKRFSQMSNLRTHKRLHTGEKPFCCTHCGMCFAQQSNLITHQRIHTGEKPFICGQCERGFSQSSSLRTHQRLHCRN